MCLLKRSKLSSKAKVQVPNRNGSVKRGGSQREQPSTHSGWPSARAATSKVTQHDSSGSASDFTGSYTQSQSRESQVSTASAGSRSSISNLRGVVGEGIHLYQYAELRRATDGFSARNKIANSVYQGTVRGEQVAVTRHKKAETFVDVVSEVKSLCSVHHTNVVSMIGACAPEEDEHVYAVFEFVEGASKLRECLRNPLSPGYCVLSSWMQRLQVALDVAVGLEYLHNCAHKSLIHKYLKSSNILVDAVSLRAKIANFGVAHLAGEFAVAEEQEELSEQLRLQQQQESLSGGLTVRRRYGASGEIVEEEPPSLAARSASMPVGRTASQVKPRLSRSRSRKLNGTRGYMAPEYISRGTVTTKTDVFAFGIILLELLSGQESISFRPDPASGPNVMKRLTLCEVILAIFNDKEPKARLREWMDPYLRDSYPLDYAVKTARLAKSCVETNPEERPEMRTVRLELQKIMTMSERWEAGMKASKSLMSQTMEASQDQGTLDSSCLKGLNSCHLLDDVSGSCTGVDFCVSVG
ncbi:hypothetical protein R1sor_021352 [Riccia sorocarpa]|uniref:Protein kinase domain-containing protein n=1 Tax=Riccia sorocarpa TaxID=122646 RepID=A0ABD3GIA9_9MARC